jgi:hypothetical protein
MPISMNWYNQELAVAHSQIVGHWTMKQFHAAWAAGRELLAERPDTRVDFIIDLSDSILIPPDFVRQFRQLSFERAQNIGMIVFIGADEHIQVLIETIRQIIAFDFSVDYADTSEAALAIIEQARQNALALSA